MRATGRENMFKSRCVCWMSTEMVVAQRGELRSVRLVETTRGRTAENGRKQNECIC